MSGHTPGPWAVHTGEDGISTEILAEDGCLFVCDSFGAGPEAEFNAMLISAAPDLYLALRNLLELHEAHHNHPDHAAARAAIAKAEGRT